MADQVVKLDPNKPPKGVSTKALWKQAVNYKRRAAVELTKRKAQAETAMEVGIGGGTALASGLLFAKFPKIASFKLGKSATSMRIDTDQILALGFLGMAIMGGKFSATSLEIAKGFGYPALYRLGATKICDALPGEKCSPIWAAA